jgi:hypothetical protein
MSAALDYLPGAIRELNARFFGGENLIGQRLCTDRRMQQVWKTLAAEGSRSEVKESSEFELRLNSLPKLYRQETWDQSIYGVSLTDRARASFFLGTAIVFSVKNQVRRASKIEREAQDWRTAAELCAKLSAEPGAPQQHLHAAVDPDLIDALRTSAAYFEEKANFIQRTNEDSPYLIGREAKLRAPGGNEAVRGQVCEIAGVMRDIFGTVLYVPLAMTASVATGLEISDKSVENWWKARLKSSPNKAVRS